MSCSQRLSSEGVPLSTVWTQYTQAMTVVSLRVAVQTVHWCSFHHLHCPVGQQNCRQLTRMRGCQVSGSVSLEASVGLRAISGSSMPWAGFLLQQGVHVSACPGLTETSQPQLLAAAHAASWASQHTHYCVSHTVSTRGSASSVTKSAAGMAADS